MRIKTKDLKNLKWANLNLMDNAVEIEILNKMTNHLHFSFNLSWEKCETWNSGGNPIFRTKYNLITFNNKQIQISKAGQFLKIFTS